MKVRRVVYSKSSFCVAMSDESLAVIGCLSTFVCDNMSLMLTYYEQSSQHDMVNTAKRTILYLTQVWPITFIGHSPISIVA